ncbi:efflux RND transporter permease subunit [Leptospira yasudae]|uniref:efflux RND transporter permease subunit n=1 Tax=Leptospira yasudae TaxID=2202201 RepID=UPI001F4D7B81|nr:efflux RND transporter permease subunit [Leptospira yasudae]
MITIIVISVFIILNTYKSYSVRVQRQILLCMIELPSGTGVGTTDKVSKKVEALLLQSPSVEETVAKVEKDHSRIIIRLKDGLQADSESIADLKKIVGKQNPAFVFFTADSDRSTGEESTFEILGSDPKTIHDLVQSVAKQVTAFPETEEVVLRYKGPREELIMNVDPGKSSLSLLDSSRLGEDLRLTLQGGIAAKAFSEGKEFDVRVRGSAEFRGSKDSLERIHVRNSENQFVPLGEVTFGKEDYTPVKVFHKYRTRYLAFSVKFRDKSSGDRVALERRILSIPLPFGYRIERGERKTFKIFDTLGEVNAGFYFFLLILVLSRVFQFLGLENRRRQTALYILRLILLFLSIRFLGGEWKSDSYLYFISIGLFL